MAGWFAERLYARRILLAVVFGVSASAIGRAATSAAGGLRLDAADLLLLPLGPAAVLIVTLADDLRDYRDDRAGPPERLSGRSLVTRRQLLVLGAIAAAVVLGTSLALDARAGASPGRATALAAVALAWSGLTSFEVVGASLRRWELAFFALHFTSTPLWFAWLAQAAAPGEWVLVSVAPFMLASLALFLMWDTAMKTKAPAEERALARSYTRSLGLRGATAAVVTSSLFSVATLAWLFFGLAAPLAPALTAGAVVLAALPIAGAFGFAARPTAAAARRTRGGAGIALVGGFGLVLLALLCGRGVAW